VLLLMWQSLAFYSRCHGSRPRLQPFSFSGYFHHVLSYEV